jgi:hypothetical protein
MRRPSKFSGTLADGCGRIPRTVPDTPELSSFTHGDLSVLIGLYANLVKSLPTYPIVDGGILG